VTDTPENVAPTVVVPAASEPIVVALTVDQWEAVKSEMHSSHRFGAFALFAMSLGVVAFGALAATNYALLNDVDETVTVIRSVTSPAAQEEQQQRTEQIVVLIDCNNRAAIQELTDELVRQGLIQSVNVTDECENP